MRVKRIMAVLLTVTVIASAVVMQGCSFFGGNTDNISGNYTVGVCQYYDSQYYTDATKGFTDQLKSRFGDHVEIKTKKASSSLSACEKIINGFVEDKVDLIMVNGDPALKTAYENVKSIPVFATGVKDYASALSVKNWKGTIGGNFSGTSSEVSFEDQAGMLSDWCPPETYAKVGILFSSKEEPSRYQADAILEPLQQKGYAVTMYTFANDSDVVDIADVACRESDIIYLPQDRSIDAAAEEINGLLLKSSTPAFTSDEKVLAKCGVAAMSVAPYEMGKKTADMVYSVLIDNKDISEMPVENSSYSKKYNSANASALGLTAPEGFEAIG